MIKIKRQEYFVRDIDFEITPENFESIKQQYIDKGLAYLKVPKNRELFKKLAESITFEQFEEYMYYTLYGHWEECDIEEKFVFESEEGFIYDCYEGDRFYVIRCLADFIDYDLEKEWHRCGELRESHIDGNSWSVDKQYSIYPIE